MSRLSGPINGQTREVLLYYPVLTAGRDTLHFINAGERALEFISCCSLKCAIN